MNTCISSTIFVLPIITKAVKIMFDVELVSDHLMISRIYSFMFDLSVLMYSFKIGINKTQRRLIGGPWHYGNDTVLKFNKYEVFHNLHTSVEDIYHKPAVTPSATPSGYMTPLRLSAIFFINCTR